MNSRKALTGYTIMVSLELAHPQYKHHQEQEDTHSLYSRPDRIWLVIRNSAIKGQGRNSLAMRSRKLAKVMK